MNSYDTSREKALLEKKKKEALSFIFLGASLVAFGILYSWVLYCFVYA